MMMAGAAFLRLFPFLLPASVVLDFVTGALSELGKSELGTSTLMKVRA